MRLRDIEDRENQQGTLAQGNREESLGAASDNFLADCRFRNLAAATLVWYETRLTKLFAKVMDRPTSWLTDSVVAELLQETRKRVGVRTLNGYMRALKAFVYWCIENGRVVSCQPRRIKQVRVDARLPTSLSDDEIGNLLATFDARDLYGLRDLALTCLLLDTGLRIGEALGITLADLDLPRITTRDTKGNADRTVRVSEPMEDLMLRWLERRGREDGYLFPSRETEQLSRRQYHDILAKHAREAGITKRVSAHVLRFTYATACLNSDMDLSALQRCLGHKSISMTLHYARLHDSKAMEESVAASPIGRLRGRGPSLKGMERRPKGRIESRSER